MNTAKKVLSLLLAALLTLSLANTSAIASVISEGSNGKNIYLSFSFTKIVDETDNTEVPITSVKQGETFNANLNFYNSPTDDVNNSIQAAKLYVKYNKEQLSVKQMYNGLDCGLTGSNPNYGEGVAFTTWTNTGGVTQKVDRKDVLTDKGTFVSIEAVANVDMCESDLRAAFALLSEYNGEPAKLEDGNKKFFTVLQVPAITVALKPDVGTIYDTTTADELKTMLDVNYIDAQGNATPVTNFDVALPADGLAEGSNQVTVSDPASGLSETLTVSVATDTVTGITVTTQPKLSYTSGEKLDLSGMTVTATCKSDKTKAVTKYTSDVAAGTELTVAGHNGKQLNITAEGKSATTNALVVNPASVAIPAATGSYTYTGAEQTFTYSNASDQYTLSGELKGTAAKDYTATAALKDKTETAWSDNTVEDKTLTWTIAPNTNALTVTLNSADEIVYDGNAKEPAVTVKSGDNTLAADDYTLTYSNNTDAGSATVKAVGKGNYAGAEGSRSFEIKRASITPVVRMEGWTYGESAKTPSVSGNSGSGAVTYTYYTNAECSTGATTSKPADAGTYWVKANVAQTANYNAGTTEAVSFTIGKASAPSNITGEVSLYHADTTAGTFEASALKNVPTAGWTDVEFVSATASDSPVISSVSVEGGKLSYTPTGTAEAGKTATVTATVSSKNYENATVTLTFKTVDINIDWTAIGENNIALKSAPVYGDKNSDILTIENADYTAKTTENVPGKLSVQEPNSYPAAGTTSVTLVFTPAEGSGISGTFTHRYPITAVAMKAITVTADAKTVVYGEAIPALTFTVPTGALVGSDTAESLDMTLATTAAQGSDVGAYDITKSACSAANYEVTVEGAGKLTITPRTLTAAISGTVSKDYDGTNEVKTSVSVTLSGIYSTDDVTAAVKSAVFTGVNAGDQKVRAQIELDGAKKGNYTLAESTIEANGTINQAAHSAMSVNDLKAKYGKTATLNLKALNLPDGYTFGTIDTTDNDKIFDDAPAIEGNTLSVKLAAAQAKVGKTGTITIPVSSTNYQDFNLIVTVTVLDKTAQTLSADAINTVYGESFTPNVSGAKTELTYKVKTDSESLLKYENGKFTAIGVGEATIVVTAAETEEYASDALEIKVTIAKRTLTVKAADKSAYIGEKLPELTYEVSGLVGSDKLTKEPTLEVKHAADVDPMKKVGEYEIGFKVAPAASANYELTTATGKLTVSVRPVYVGPTGSPVEVGRSDNGTVTASPANAAKGTTVTITANPGKGQELKSLEVLDQHGSSLPLTDLGNGKFSFVMPAGKVTVKPVFGAANAYVNPYMDVQTNDWYFGAVQYVTENGLMNGTGNGFEPNLATSRAMIWTILARMSNVNTASGGEWYAVAQQWAKANGVSDGTMPNGTITREQLAAMLYRYAVSKGMVKAPVTANLSIFAGASSVSTYANEAMQWAVSTGLINGMDGKLNPQGSATRAQVATMLMRFAELIK